MRYYSIVITDPDTGDVLVPNPGARQYVFTLATPGLATYASHSGTAFYPGALNIDMDVLVYPFAQPEGGSYVRIWGISLAEIGQHDLLTGKNIAVYGGFKTGLPLAKPAQSGLLFAGKIFQAFGNWQGTEQTLDLVIWPDLGTSKKPKNLVLNWKAGMLLSDAIDQTLAVAYPDIKRTIKINKNLVYSGDQTHVAETLPQLASYIKGITQKIGPTKDYPGVDIILKQNEIIVYDGSTPTAPIIIAFEDMIGQPTWIDKTTINISFAMRADLGIQDVIQLPQGLLGTPYVLTNPGATFPDVPATSSLKNYIGFTGNFHIISVHHFGNFRQPDANSWVTVVNAAADISAPVPTPAPAPTPTPAPTVPDLGLGTGGLY
jgi:hypothetical protein